MTDVRITDLRGKDLLERALRDEAIKEIPPVTDAFLARTLLRADDPEQQQVSRTANLRSPGDKGRSALLRIAPYALAASLVIVGGVALRAVYLANPGAGATTTAQPKSTAAAYLARNLSSVETLLRVEAPRKAAQAIERFVNKPTLMETQALRANAAQLLTAFRARAQEPLRIVTGRSRAQQ